MTTIIVVIIKMIATEKIHKDLVKLGLNNTQAELYLLLVRQGNLRINEIAEALSLPRSSVYENLKGLFKLGLAEEIIENSHKTIQAYPISLLRHNFQEKIAVLEEKTGELEHIERSINKLAAAKLSAPTVVRYYKGRAGARQIFWNTLKSQDTLYVCSEWGRGRYLGIKFYQNFVAESHRRGLQEKVLTNYKPEVLASIHQHYGTSVSRTKLENIRLIPPKTIRFKGETLMHDSVYAQVYLKDEVINGFEIENRQFVTTQRAIFETLWDGALPLNEVL